MLRGQNMTNMIYERGIVKQIKKYLYSEDIIVLHGARQVGKTSILYYLENYLKKIGRKTHYIDLEDSRYVKILDLGVKEFINYLREEGVVSGFKKPTNKKTFVFIDEIQYLKNPSSFLKLIADHNKEIKLIVSGSSSFDIKKKFKDSLVGRTVDFEIFNLSFQEFLLFKKYHFEKKKIFTEKKITELKQLFAEYVLHGGYPKIVLTNEIYRKEKYLQQIIDTYIKKDIRDLAEIKDVDKFNKLMEALSCQSGKLLNIAELSNTCNISKQTVEKYLFLLENTYILKLVRPYSKNIRSELFKVRKIYFYDTGLMQMLWLKSLQKEIIGDVFETAVFSELIKNNDKDKVFYWRTTDKKEIDFILKMKSGVLPIEVKLNFEQVSLAAIKYFREYYKLKKFKIVGLKGRKMNKFYIYPWDL